jgi:chromosome partitioning protein
MRVIALVSQKGGTGKTTLSGHLAVQAGTAGAGPVALVDTDPQGSLTDWWNARKAEMPAFVHTSIQTLEPDLEVLEREGIELVIIDTPPALTSPIIAVVRVADLVLIPVRPSPHDISAAGMTVELVEMLGKPLVFVVNCASPHARISSDAAIVLSQHGTVASPIVHQRTDFASSMIDGRTVMEIKRASRSVREIRGLWDYVGRRLEKVAPVGVVAADLEPALPARLEWPAAARRSIA